MNKTFNLLSAVVGFTLFLGLLPSCGSKPNPQYDEAAKCIAIDESLKPVMDEELQAFHVKTRLGPLYPLYINEQDAVDSLLNQKVFLIYTTRRLTPKEESILKSRQYNARIVPAAFDALALIVHKDNPDTVITVEKVKKILSGQVTTWKEIFPDSKLDTIRVAFDNPRSSAVRFCNDSILAGQEMKTSGNIRAVNSSPAVIEYVEKHKGAIGIVGCNWLDSHHNENNLTYGRGITKMAVGTTPLNAEKPEQRTIALGQYPFLRTIYSICTDPRSTGTPRRFHNFVLNPGEGDLGQRIFHSAGLWPAYRDYVIREVQVK